MYRWRDVSLIKYIASVSAFISYISYHQPLALVDLFSNNGISHTVLMVHRFFVYSVCD